ncbi:hypothetical protein [Roseibium sp.]|uniref:hypothetical protein n=1 Tax=Roseibium sp. TaxID=1936156 RepID=UPI003BAD918B
MTDPHAKSADFQTQNHEPQTVTRKRSRDLQDARPLLQAICLGIFLAAILTAAAAIAGSEAKDTTTPGTTIPALTQPLPSEVSK